MMKNLYLLRYSLLDATGGEVAPRHMLLKATDIDQILRVWQTLGMQPTIVSIERLHLPSASVADLPIFDSDDIDTQQLPAV